MQPVTWEDRDFLLTGPTFTMVDLHLSEYALQIVTEYGYVEVRACSDCSGWGCRTCAPSLYNADTPSPTPPTPPPPGMA